MKRIFDPGFTRVLTTAALALAGTPTSTYAKRHSR